MRPSTGDSVPVAGAPNEAAAPSVTPSAVAAPSRTRFLRETRETAFATCPLSLKRPTERPITRPSHFVRPRRVTASSRVLYPAAERRSGVAPPQPEPSRERPAGAGALGDGSRPRAAGADRDRCGAPDDLLLVGPAEGGHPPFTRGEGGQPLLQQLFGLLRSVVRWEQLLQGPVLLEVAALEQEDVRNDPRVAGLRFRGPETPPTTLEVGPLSADRRVDGLAEEPLEVVRAVDSNRGQRHMR